MGNDALIAALLRAADYINNDGSTLSATATANVIETLRDHAATLRQQAFSQFANPEALADWLDALHECHADGSVGNRKWEAAQVAARAIRSLNEPSGNSGQLRQQAGRVDDAALLEIARDSGLRRHLYGVDATKAKRLLRAFVDALAQNTQGEFSMLAGACNITGPKDDVLHIAKIIGEPNDLHAERARVPDGWTARRDDELRLWWVYSPSGDAAGIYDQAAGVHAELLRQVAQHIAAAPSQRAEVK